MKEGKNPQLPFLFESPSYFMISLNTVEFSELGFRDFVDGRYEVSLPMNPTLRKNTNAGLGGEFDFNQTADLSQNNLNGSLLGGAAFPMEMSNGIQDSVEQIGFRGQAIKFPASGSVVVQNHNVFKETNFGTTFEIFVKPISDLTTVAENAYLVLLNKPGSMSLILEKNRQLHGRITINGKEFSTGFIGSGLELNQWSHVATTHDPSLGLFRVFVNGQKISELKVDQGVMSASTSTLIIGPGGQNPVSKTDFLLHLDEFKFSSVARSSVELADSAGIPYAQRNRSLTALLPSSFTSRDVRLPLEINLDTNKVQLGFLLFNDPRLSSNDRISCSSCHSANNGFADPVDFSVGVSGQKLARHSPTVFNRLFGSTQMWDGRFTSLEQQSGGPVTHPAEMGMASYQALVSKLKLNSSYVKAFQTVYGSEIKPEHIGNALASFQLSLISGTSRYDSYFADGRTTALSLDEIKGKDLFFGKAKCAACHSGPNFTDELYHNTGLFPADADKGRGDISHRASESRFFKTPTLRNLSSSAPYMHNGSLQTLEQVVLLYNAGGTSDSLRDSEIKPLNLTSNEIAQLVSFLGTLNSEIKPIVIFDMSVKNVEDVYPTSSPPVPPPTVPPVCMPNSSTTSGCTQPTNGQSRKTCNSTGTAYGACTISCNTGFEVKNGQCVALPPPPPPPPPPAPAPVCTANSTTTSGCTQPANGQSKKTCNSTGTAYGACTISCNTGFEVKNGQCVALPPSGPRVDFFSILTSDLSRPMSNSDFVENLYRAVLGRGSDSSGFADHKAKLDSSAVTRENTRIGFMKSDEFLNVLFKTDNRAWVKNLYKTVLRRESDSGGENFWVNSLNAGTHSRLAAVNGFLNLSEYINITKKDNIEDGSSLSPVCTANSTTTSGCTQPTNGRRACNSGAASHRVCGETAGWRSLTPVCRRTLQRPLVALSRQMDRARRLATRPGRLTVPAQSLATRVLWCKTVSAWRSLHRQFVRRTLQRPLVALSRQMDRARRLATRPGRPTVLARSLATQALK
ncbi:MAG: DUF4214 domain-containing protein [Bdellovibrionales bacterium]|nr:DUF4214 domain-containing protein [Bdellovibrionales bacterium]